MPPPSSAPAPLLRTFIAVELPDAVRQQVQDYQRDLRKKLDQEQLSGLFRWTHGDNLHLTLRFLGDTTGEQQAQMERAMTALALTCPAFRLAVQKVGAFPNLRKPNIIWLDFAGQLHLLTLLQAKIEHAAQAAGFAAEERAFAPHLTIARAQKNVSPPALARAGHLLDADAPLQSPPTSFLVDQIFLIRSDLRPSGPVYRPLAAFPLAV